MAVHNDFGCKRCGREERNRVLPSGEAPFCCGNPMLTLWDHGKAPATDLHEPQFNHATGQYHRSTHEAEMVLAKQARAWSDRTGMKFIQPISAGDKVGGARYESKPTGAAFGYAGQASRTSTGERKPHGSTADPMVQQPAPDASRYVVNGIVPKRMTKDQAATDRKSRTYET